MISIKRKTFALVIFSVLALLVAQGCQNSSTSVPAASASSDTQDTNISIDTSPDTTNLVPNIVGETFEHGEFNLRDSVGRPTVINFWSYNCEPCVQVISDLQDIYEEYGDRVDFIGVLTPDYVTEQEAREFLDDAGITYPNLIDGTLRSEYRADGYPLTLVVNADQTQYREIFGGGPLDHVTGGIAEFLNPVPFASSDGLVPNIVGETFEHGDFNLRDSIGKPAVINFWYHGCDSCAQTVSDVQNAYEQYGDQVDFIGVFLNYNNEPEARSFLDDAGITYPNLRISTVQPEYGVDVYPFTFVVNEDQTDYQEIEGAGPHVIRDLSRYISDLLGIPYVDLTAGQTDASESEDSEPKYNRSVPVFGKPAPDISAAGESTADINEETLEHGVFNLSESVGKPTIIHFWTAFCGENCSKNLPKLQHAYEKYGDQVDFIGIFVPAFGDIEQDVRDVLNGYNVTFPNLIDSELKYTRGYSLEYYPFTVFLNADHTQRYERNSIRDLEASIQLLLTGNPVPDEDQNGGIILDLVGETFDHGFFNLDSSLGRGAVTYFWAPSCEGCVEGLREVQKLYERYSESEQVEFVGIFSPSFGDSEQDARQIIADEGITFPNLTDSDMTLLDSYLDRWGGDKAEATLPTFYMVDEYRDRVVYSVGRQIEYERLESSLITTLVSESPPPPPPRSNKPIPDTISDGESSTDINEETLDHGVFNLSESVGKPTIIQFWASFCGANCTRNLPKIQYAYEKYGDQINFIGIFVPAFGDLEQDVRDVLNDQNITFPHLIDSELKYARGYSLEYYPLTVFVNADRTQQYQRSSVRDLAESIELLLNDNPIPDEDQNRGIIADLIGETFDHGLFDLDGSIGRGALVYFWAPSCEGCVEGLREVQKLYERYGGEVLTGERVEFIGVFSPSFGDSEQDARQIIMDEGITFPNLTDSDMTLFDDYIADRRDAETGATLPSFFVVDEYRTKLGYSVGRQIEYERLEESLLRALDE